MEAIVVGIFSQANNFVGKAGNCEILNADEDPLSAVVVI
jgi:hypothetical protein